MTQEYVWKGNPTRGLGTMDQRTSARVILLAAMVGLGGVVASGSATSSAAMPETRVPPVAETTHAYGISATGAILLGRINPRGERTVVRFQIGRTRSYGHEVPRFIEEEWFGEEFREVEEVVQCLRPHTTYHYRVVAKSRAGTAYGEDQTFRTRARHYKPKHPPCKVIE